MFCVKCGAELANDVLFCTKCGERTSVKSASSIKDDINSSNIKNTKSESRTQVKSIPNKEVNKNVKTLVPMGAIIVVLLVIIVKLVAGRNGASGSDLFASKKNDDKADLSMIAEECPECGAAIETLLELEELGNSFGFKEDEMQKDEKLKYNQMHHNCSADTVMVENKLYVYKCAVGLYSGEWKGAGPFGKGSFIGTIKNSSHLVSYDGDWAYGLPEGKGTLFTDRAYGPINMTYQGDMMAGMRHGVGLLLETPEYNSYGDYLDNSKKHYTVYEETTFENDNISRETFRKQCNAETNEDEYYDIVIGDGKGSVNSVYGSWKAGEMSPMEKQQLRDFEDTLALAFAGWLLYKSFNYWEGSEAQQWLDEYKAGCEADVVTWRQKQDDMKLDLLAKEANANAYAAARYDYEKASNQLGENHYKTKESKNWMDFCASQVK